ncbi:MAG: ParB/RepB/Spo0J family partition protein [Bacilli bacterium]|nr:ParB/RepB/Spo0J family partition protein [Bacilli bacterium]
MKMEAQIQMIPLDQLLPNSFQPRIEFDQESIERLSNSIKVHGIILPLTVKRVNNKFEIISGERRLKAAQMAGLTAVPCIICAIDENESAEVSIIEKLHSQELTAIEEAKCYKKLLDKGYINQDQLLQRMGIDAAKFEGKLRLLNLAQPVQDALLKNKISEKHARSLLKVLDPNQQVELLNDVINSRLTVKQLDDKIDILLGNKTLEDFGDELNINETKPEFRPEEYQYNSSIKDTGSNNPFFNNLENAPVSMDDPTLSMGENPFLGEQRFKESGIIDIDGDLDDDIDVPGEEVTKKDEINLEIFTPKDLMNAIKKVIEKAKENDLDIKIEEFDFTDINQMIIKVAKEKKEETEETA